MLSFLFLLALVRPRSLNASSFDETVASESPAVVRFFSEQRSGSVKLNTDWQRFEEMYRDVPGITIARVNCGKNTRLCLRETAWDQPKVRLYANHTVHDYDGGMSYESLADWTRRITGIEGKILDLDLLSPNNRTFHDLLATRHCVFTMFHNPSCRTCARFMDPLREIGRLFRSDSVAICEVDTDKFKSFFFDYNVRKFPAFRLFVDGTVRKYKGDADASEIVSFINSHCGTARHLPQEGEHTE